MLEPPNIPIESIGACLLESYGLPAAQVTFLPLGADVGTAVYRADAGDGGAYFVKLRRGALDELSVLLPAWLHGLGIAEIIPPLPASDGRLWARLGEFTLVLFPFVAGQDGYRAAMSEAQWRAFGAAFRRMHRAAPPPEIARRIPRERYDPAGRAAVRAFLDRVAAGGYEEPVAARLAAFLHAQRAATLALVARAERLAEQLQARALPAVVCHGDIHAGNVLIAGERLFIVDWDTALLAPKERDLMFVGGGQGFVGPGTRAEAALFYAGYGAAEVDQPALAYYRYERIVQDIAAFCEALLLTDEGGADREQSLHYLMSNYAPDGTIAVAYAAERGSVQA